MANPKRLKKDFSALSVSPQLRKSLQTISDKCIICKFCKQECAFLQKYGKPKLIADSYDPGDKNHQGMAFECNLCELCTAVCPVDLHPAEMFLEMRREAVRSGQGDLPEHGGILAYEKRGTSQRYTYYALPQDCDTVFFPGCVLPGTRPDTTWSLFEHLRKTIPSLGIVLDCCTKPSHDLGRDDYFTAMFAEMREFLVNHGIRNVIVACPNCYKIFSRYGRDLAVKTIYELLAQGDLPTAKKFAATISVHDPCAVRYEGAIQAAVRDLCTRQGLSLQEMPHHQEKTLCCGEGGSVGFVTPELAKKWAVLRKRETNGNRIITYCAGCANFLSAATPTSHVLDLLVQPEATLAGKAKVAKAPFTYWHRLKLKKRLKTTGDAAITRERTFTAGAEIKKGGASKRLFFIALIIGAILALRFSGATQYLEQGRLRHLIQGYGVLAPIIYMLLYTVAPVFFLPGLPLTVVGGILFGPFWGVVYTITSSTAGACLAFLVSRYIARDWVASKLKGPRWRRLDEGVERHGWKVVAFTRLIPVFPFNLLNYAFGLTKVRFLHYAVATFFFMLPACIAFIVFSSSLLDVLRGKISPTFVAGLLLVVGVSLIPVLYKRYKEKKGTADPLSGKAARPAPEENGPTAPALKKSLINKGIVLALMAAAALAGYQLVSHYWYFLNAYMYTMEFYVLFAANNLKNANLNLFRELLSAMHPSGLAFPMILYSLGVQNFWLPFSKQILPQAAISSWGLGVGGIYTYLSLVIVGFVSFGLGVFFLGDIIPFFQAKSQKNCRQNLTRHAVIPLALLLAVPYVPLSLPGVVAGALRIPWKKALGLMSLGVAVRALWLIFVPQMFT
jgi:uncharacterized membrane protein YdjX (TVP38/TMEM64 family)/Fe-S oxidoreductase